MSGKAIFWLCLTAYYGILISVLAVRFVRSFLAKREELKLARMSEAERTNLAKYWRWCY